MFQRDVGWDIGNGTDSRENSARDGHRKGRAIGQFGSAPGLHASLPRIQMDGSSETRRLASSVRCSHSHSSDLTFSLLERRPLSQKDHDRSTSVPSVG
jgi:hypothetical protein